MTKQPTVQHLARFLKSMQCLNPKFSSLIIQITKSIANNRFKQGITVGQKLPSPIEQLSKQCIKHNLQFKTDMHSDGNDIYQSFTILTPHHNNQPYTKHNVLALKQLIQQYLPEYKLTTINSQIGVAFTKITKIT